MTICSRNIPQHHRLRVEVIDHEIESTIAIEISDCETSSGPRIRERISGRRADALKLPFHVPEEQRLLRITRTPLMRVRRRVNMTIDDEQIQPTIVVVVDEARAPAEKRNRDLA